MVAPTRMSSCARWSPVDPRLRRHGGACLAVSHGEPLGALSPPPRFPEKDDELVLPHAAQQAERQDDKREARRGVHVVPIADDEKEPQDEQHIRVSA